jgi:hypothetical protein
MARHAVILLSCLPFFACGGDDDDGNSSVADESDSSATNGNTSGSTQGSTNGNTSGSTNGNTSSSSNGNTSGDPATDCDLDTAFDGNAGGWPSPWTDVGGTATADVVDGRGRLVPTTNNYSLGRMFAPLDCTDAEVTFKFEFTDGASQGIGVYVRQNGGHLQTTNPHGSGYAVFIEAFRQPYGIGVWHEIDGVETVIDAVVPFAVEANVVYAGRLRVTQAGADATHLQARMWRDGDSEPATWQVDRMDSTPNLQNTSGGLAIDSWSSRTTGDAAPLFVDEIVMRAAE